MKEGWEVKKLGEVATYINGYAFKPAQWGDSGVPIIRIQNLNNSDALHNYYDGEIPNKYVVEYGDILISWSASLGVYEWKGQRSYLNQHIFKVVFDKIDINKYFLKYAVSGKLAEMLKDAHGATMKHVVKKDFDNTKIIYPPLPEQSRIVEELDLLSNIIEKKRKQLSELDNLAQSIFYDMFGDPVTNEKGWEVKTLGQIANFKNGVNFQKVDNGFEHLFLSVSDFKDNIKLTQKSDFSVILVNEPIDEDYLLLDDDIVFVRSNGSKSLVGRNVIVYTNGEKITYSGFCIRCRIMLENLLPIYVNNLLSSYSIKLLIKNLGRGANISNLNQTMLSSVPIILPPLSLQQLFAQKIEAIEKQKALIKQSIAETEELFNSRMDYYFS